MDGPMKILTLTLLLAVCGPGLAQTDMYMPAGTNEVNVGAALVSDSSAEGDTRRRTFIAPHLSVQFSNGFFISPSGVGMQLSSKPSVRYGPLLTYAVGRRADAKDDKLKLRLQAGAFLRYRVIRGLDVYSSALYGGGDDHQGLRVNAGASYGTPLASHHAASIGATMSWANQDYMESYFGTAAYRPNAGVHSVRANFNWNWELGTRYSLTTGTGVSRLLGGAADSPIVRKATNVSFFTSLNYQF
jgi:outer membrane protein